MKKAGLLTIIIISGFVLTSFTGKQILRLNNAPVITHEEVTIDFDVYNDCSQEWVHLSGTAQITSVVNINNNRMTGYWHMNYQGVRGEGLSSGTSYHVNGVTNQPYSAPVNGGANTISLITRMNMIGGGNNYSLKGNYHGTMNAKGTVTSYFDNFSVSCK